MAQTLEKGEEKALAKAAERALDLVDCGLSPDVAVSKIARDEGLTPALRQE
jgi:hypothetical protein